MDDFIFWVLAEAEQFNSGRFNDTSLFSDDNPHCRNAVTISQQALSWEGYLIFRSLHLSQKCLISYHKCIPNGK